MKNIYQLLMAQASIQPKPAAVTDPDPNPDPDPDPELPIPVISFTQPNDMAVGDPDQVLVFGSTNKGVPVVITASNTSFAKIVNGGLRALAEGEFNLTASQAAGNGFAAPAPVSYKIKVTAVDYTVTELTGTLQTFEGNSDLYYDPANPTRFIASDFYRPFLIGNAANTGLFRAEQVRVNFNGSGKNVFELTPISATGEKPSGGQAASGITYTAFKSNDLRPNKGANLTKLIPGDNNYVYDVDSNPTAEQLYGALTEVGTSVSGRTETHQYYPSDVQPRGALNVFNLEPFPYGTPAPLPANLYGAKWRVAVPLPISFAPVFPDFTGIIRILIFGDSNTEFQQNAFLLALQRAYPNATIVFENRGKAGSRADQWQPGSQALNDLIASANAKEITIISINLGTNDITNGTTKPQYISYMQNIADELFDKVSTLKHFFIQGIFSYPLDARVDEYNALIPTIGHRYTQGTFATLPILRANPWLMSTDGVHLQKAGYDVNAQEMLKVMQPAINAS